MSLNMSDVDGFINNAINRLASENGSTTSNYYVDLRSYQKRVTQNLIDQCSAICHSRGLKTQHDGDGLVVTVNLHTCFLNPQQTKAYDLALNYTRFAHGNHV
jgi:hypothetical protein